MDAISAAVQRAKAIHTLCGTPTAPAAGVRGLPEAAALLRSFPQADEAADKAAHAAAVRQWNADLIRKVHVGQGVGLRQALWKL